MYDLNNLDAERGFRVEGTDRTGRPTGTIVIRVNGEWVETASAGAITPAH